MSRLEIPAAPVFARYGSSFTLVPVPKCIHGQVWNLCKLCTVAWMIPWRRA